MLNFLSQILRGILIFIIICLLGFTGLMVYQMYKENRPQPIKTTPVSNPTPNPESAEYKQFMRTYCNFLADTEDMDCGDFSDREQAQRTHDNTIKCFGSDIFQLDADNDGIACEPYYP